MGFLIWRTIRDRRNTIITYTLLTVLLMWMYVALFPSLQKQAANFDQLFKTYPKGLMAAFGIETLSFDHFDSYLSTETFNFTWPLLVVLISISFASSGIAGDIERGTSEILLARPLSRAKIFFGRYFATLAVLIVFTGLSVYTPVMFASFSSITYDLSQFHTFLVLSLLYAWAVMSVSFCISTLVSEKGKALGLAGGLFVLMYIFNLFGQLSDKVSWMTKISYFKYFDPIEGLVHHHLAAGPLLVFGLSILLATGLGVFWFQRRDIAT